MTFARDDKGNEEVLLRIPRRDLDELISVLKDAEEICELLRQRAQDFRIHRLRLLQMKQESTLPSTVPPPPSAPQKRDTTRYVDTSDLNAVRRRG